MRNPEAKVMHKLLPTELLSLFQKAIEQQYDGKIYDKQKQCPYCNSKKAWKYDKQSKLFCKLMIQNGIKDVKSTVVRYQCSKCRKVFFPETPFYPGCLYGKPVVDFCLFLSASNPFNRVERTILEHGIQIDRKTVANYAVMFKDKLKKKAGVKLSGEAVGVNFLKLFFNVRSVNELKKKYPKQRYDSVSDETYPAKRGARQALAEENKLRKYFKLKEKKYPDSFTLAVGYMPSIKSYASLILTQNPFNQMFARLLRVPLNGVDYNLTDGHKAYNKLPNHERCLFHISKNLAKKDNVLKQIEKGSAPEDVKQYLREQYAKLKEGYLKYMKEKYPQMVEADNFTGALTTNAIEGGNWRIKFELRTSYKNIDNIESRAALICIMDSMYCFRQGKANESFTHANSSFVFNDVMSVALKKENSIESIIPHSGFNPLSVRGKGDWYVIIKRIYTH